LPKTSAFASWHDCCTPLAVPPDVHSEPSSPAPALDGLGEVIGDALRHAQELVRAEIALAKNELRAEIASAKYACIAFALGGFLLNGALLVTTIGVLLMLGQSSTIAFVIAGALLVCAVLTLLLGKRLLRVPELRRTRSRIARNVRVLAHAAERSPR
jgi:hypothetical protein